MTTRLTAARESDGLSVEFRIALLCSEKSRRSSGVSSFYRYFIAEAKPSRKTCSASPQGSRIRNSGCNFRTTALPELPAIFSMSNSAVPIERIQFVAYFSAEKLKEAFMHDEFPQHTCYTHPEYGRFWNKPNANRLHEQSRAFPFESG